MCRAVAVYKHDYFGIVKKIYSTVSTDVVVITYEQLLLISELIMVQHG